jgi:hypothetical protein
VHEWKPQLGGYEIVIASTNNGAVENVTVEIPSVDAIDAAWRAEADYFGALATGVLGRPAWGAVAARLGNRTNRNDFAKAFWFHRLSDERAQPPYAGMREILDGPVAEISPGTWRDAVAAFRAAESAALDIARTRTAAHTARAAAGNDAGDGGSTGSGGGEADDAGRELTAPYNDEEWNTARSRLFLEALRLHRAFIAASAARMRANLAVAMDILAGSAPGDLPPAAALAAWRSLFLVVPVVSTTFASFDRVFAHLRRESLGWLLIDEAGQAVPQAAAGAIWRAKRVVSVGDPRQLEPVVTLPPSAQQALRGHYGVAEKWLPGRTSVQQLADQVNPLGTWLPDEDGPVWIGAPLRVHRRCDLPMFTVANRIAYDGLMVHATPDRNGLTIPDSMWIDVASDRAEGHWIPREGNAAYRVLATLARHGVGMDDVLAIAPFRDVAAKLRTLERLFGGLKTGTIHTAQGKEADVVVLVLGGNPGRPGAKEWATARPNLLNVAVSRAKRRLYVIGDRASWSAYPFFDVLADELVAFSPTVY